MFEFLEQRDMPSVDPSRTSEENHASRLVASCHCQKVRLSVALTPTILNECQCSICRRYAVRWAYFKRLQVQFLGAPDATEIYVWGDRMLEFHRCSGCGCVTHWLAIDPAEEEMAINARLFEPEAMKDVPVKVTAGPPD